MHFNARLCLLLSYIPSFGSVAAGVAIFTRSSDILCNIQRWRWRLLSKWKIKRQMRCAKKKFCTIKSIATKMPRRPYEAIKTKLVTYTYWMHFARGLVIHLFFRSSFSSQAFIAFPVRILFFSAFKIVIAWIFFQKCFHQLCDCLIFLFLILSREK